MRETVKNLAQNLEDRLVGIRRHLHANPELSFQEKETSSYIQGILTELNVPFTTGWAGYGIVATLENGEGSHRLIDCRIKPTSMLVAMI